MYARSHSVCLPPCQCVFLMPGLLLVCQELLVQPAAQARAHRELLFPQSQSLSSLLLCGQTLGLLYSGLECWELEEGRRESIETQYKPKTQPQHALWPSHTSCLGHFKKAIVLMLPHYGCNDNYSSCGVLNDIS